MRNSSKTILTFKKYCFLILTMSTSKGLVAIMKGVGDSMVGELYTQLRIMPIKLTIIINTFNLKLT